MIFLSLHNIASHNQESIHRESETTGPGPLNPFYYYCSHLVPDPSLSVFRKSGHSSQKQPLLVMTPPPLTLVREALVSLQGSPARSNCLVANLVEAVTGSLILADERAAHYYSLLISNLPI